MHATNKANGRTLITNVGQAVAELAAWSAPDAVNRARRGHESDNAWDRRRFQPVLNGLAHASGLQDKPASRAGCAPDAITLPSRRLPSCSRSL